MKKFTTTYLLTLILIIVSSNNYVYSQTQSVSNVTETGVWNGIYLKVKLSEKFGYYAEHHYRLRNSQDNLYSFVGRNRQVYNRAGINIFFNKYFEAVIGPTLVFNFSPDKNNPNYEKVTLEPRIWHQWLLIMPSMGRVKFFHQFRFEHRWKRSNTVDALSDYTNRYRYKLFGYIPINHKKIQEKTLYFSPSFEIFMHSGKSIVYNPFEDFRTYNGFGYVMNKNCTFFVGHMWTFGQSSLGYQYNKTHIIRINVFIGLDGRKIDDKLPKINIGY